MNLKSAIKHVDIVSFDIFDTLLVRPYRRPTDLFLHMERVYKIPFFAIARTTAEYQCRQNTSREDITLDDIYNEIAPEFRAMKEKELAWEKMVLRPNPEMRKIWDIARGMGKRIIITSDMYLPSEFIERVLHKNGFGDYNKLYVSGDIGKTKCTGTLFDMIIRDTGVAPKRILHIGDNKKSDYKKPRSRGMRAYLYPQITQTYIKNNPHIAKFNRKTNYDLGAGILISIMAIRDKLRQINKTNENYWNTIGYKYGGPVIYGYTRFIQRTAIEQNTDHIIFVARDGYTLQRIFNTFDNKIGNSYVYAPRFLNLICRMDYNREDIKQSGAIIDYFCEKYPEINKLRNTATLTKWRDYHGFIQSNIDKFSVYAKTEFDNYRKYLMQKINSAKSVLIIDTITARFSSQKLIQDILGTPTHAIYWSVIKYAYEGIYGYTEFIKNDNPDGFSFTKNWNFMEFLMTAPEYPIKNMKPNGEPIYDSNPSESEKIRKQIYPYISDGAINFANDIKKLFGGNDIYLNGCVLVEYINAFVDYPTRHDRIQMQQIAHAYDSAHSDYIPLFSAKMPMQKIFKQPSKCLNIAKNIIWRSPLQTLAVCLCAPLKIHMRGIKQIQILLFPKLKHRYLTIKLRLSGECFYQITIGKPKL
ncbi:MAG: HAD family hydrolase [Candidatus Enterousia sp.]